MRWIDARLAEKAGIKQTYNTVSIPHNKPEPEKPGETAGMSQEKLETERLNATNETIFFDDKTNYLWFTNDRKTRLEPKDAEVLKAMIDNIKKTNRRNCRKEEILQVVYKIQVSTTQKLPKEDKSLNSAISTINGKVEKDLDITDKLIQTDGLRMIKFSRNIEVRKM